MYNKRRNTLYKTRLSKYKTEKASTIFFSISLQLSIKK